MAWRWQLLLAARGIHEPLSWLTNMYFVGYAATQVLPTGVGGDAVRILEHSRRRPGRGGEVAAAVLLERVIGAAGVLVMVAIGLVAAIGRYDDIRYLVSSSWSASLLVGCRHVPALLDAGAQAPPAGLRGVAARLRVRAATPARCTRRCTPIAATPREGCSSCSGSPWPSSSSGIVSIWLCGLAVGIELSITRLRDPGAAALPRDDDPVHDQRSRRAGGLLRRLPRAVRRRPRHRLRSRVPLHAVTIATASPRRRLPALAQRPPGARPGPSRGVRTVFQATSVGWLV